MLSRFFFIVVFFHLNTTVFSKQWVFEYEKDGIKVYTSNVERSGFKAFKGEMLVDYNAEQLLGFISKVELFPQWCYQTTATQVINREDNKTYYRYVSATPPMVKNREAYFCNTIETNPQTGETIITMQTYNSKDAVPKGYIRMPSSEGFWKITPISRTSSRVVFQMHADPGGQIPSWLANMFTTDSPYITMMNLRKMLSEQ
jgi:ribosome-associated toxin RatA of RatAB toxin-antitoxin module